MSVNSKMTALADAIRTLSGTTGTMGLDAMTSNVGDANENVNTEAELIAQIASALEGKAGGSGGGSVETCTVIVRNTVAGRYMLLVSATTFDGNSFSPYVYAQSTNNLLSEVTIDNVVCGSAITSVPQGISVIATSLTNATDINGRSGTMVHMATVPGETAIIEYYDNN